MTVMHKEKVDPSLEHAFNPLRYPIAARVPKRFDVPTPAWIGHIPFGMNSCRYDSPQCSSRARNALGCFLLRILPSG